MARSPNCTGAPLFKGRVDVSISYPDPDETPLETPVALPTSEPASPQVSFTLATKHLPTWSPYELPHSKMMMLCAGGKNTSGGTLTVYWRVKINGANHSTGSNSYVSASQYWTLNSLDLPIPASVGDTVDAYLWASGAGVDWQYKAFACMPTRIGPYDIALADVVVAHDNYYPVLTKGPNPYSSTAYGYIQPMSATNKDLYCFLLYGTNLIRVAAPYATWRLLRAWWGDRQDSNQINTNSSAMPLYYRNYRITRIAYTPLNLRV
ncbi:MAG: hypothetical protein VB144_11420 [Clostridia bacterium]|nr:hypothetical protein [Clostridia bacterium]